MNILVRPIVMVLVALAAAWVGVRFAWARNAPGVVMIVVGLPLLWWAAVAGCPA